MLSLLEGGPTLELLLKYTGLRCCADVPIVHCSVPEVLTWKLRIVSLIDQEDIYRSVSCAISGSGKRGFACIAAPTAGRNDPSSVGPLPDYDTEYGHGVLRPL